MFISKTTATGKRGKPAYIELLRVSHGSLGLSTNKGISVTLTGRDGHFVTIQAAEFALMRKWFEKNGCEE